MLTALELLASFVLIIVGAIGAIIGAPFLLGTLAMLLVVGSAHRFKRRREHGAEVVGDSSPPLR